jgi:hypothetical protein
MSALEILLVLGGAAIATVCFLAALLGGQARDIDEASWRRARVGLHQARRNLDVAQFRVQAKSDATRMRRELDEEMRWPESGRRTRNGV